jgi:hypothetical protein
MNRPAIDHHHLGARASEQRPHQSRPNLPGTTGDQSAKTHALTFSEQFRHVRSSAGGCRNLLQHLNRIIEVIGRQRPIAAGLDSFATSLTSERRKRELARNEIGIRVAREERRLEEHEARCPDGGCPPNHGRICFAMIGWSRNSRNALRKIVAAWKIGIFPRMRQPFDAAGRVRAGAFRNRR